MTTKNKETEFDVRKPLAHNVCVRVQSEARQDDTTEARLKDVREQMVLTRAKKTIRNTGHYFTEPYPACGECELGMVASYLE